MSRTTPKSTSAAETSDSPGPILRARGIQRAFKMGDSSVQVLKGCNLTLKQGEFVAIEGRSGSGKSTLLHIMGALDEADAGNVEFDGEDLTQMSSVQRSRLRNKQFGFIFQFYHLLPELNVLENTLLAAMIEYSWLGFRSNRKPLQARAVDLLTQFGLSHRLKHRPNHLSGGERQRVAIARALILGTRVLVVDEPTASLDRASANRIISILKDTTSDGIAVLVASHDHELVRLSDTLTELI
jgi:lipoprotein-releasing system ATP-binding protein